MIILSFSSGLKHGHEIYKNYKHISFIIICLLTFVVNDCLVLSVRFMSESSVLGDHLLHILGSQAGLPAKQGPQLVLTNVSLLVQIQRPF